MPCTSTVWPMEYELRPRLQTSSPQNCRTWPGLIVLILDLASARVIVPSPVLRSGKSHLLATSLLYVSIEALQ